MEFIENLELESRIRIRIRSATAFQRWGTCYPPYIYIYTSSIMGIV